MSKRRSPKQQTFFPATCQVVPGYGKGICPFRGDIANEPVTGILTIQRDETWLADVTLALGGRGGVSTPMYTQEAQALPPAEIAEAIGRCEGCTTCPLDSLGAIASKYVLRAGTTPTELARQVQEQMRRGGNVSIPDLWVTGASVYPVPPRTA